MSRTSKIAGRKKSGPPHLEAWCRSSEFREIARKQIQKLNKERWSGPRCGAARKSDGEPCRRIAMTNGRCQLHGGKTPKGDQWHVTQWPSKTQTRAMEKLNRKLEDIERDAADLKKRLAKMTPAERAGYEEWKRVRKPGSVAARTLKRKDAENAAAFRAISESTRSESVSAEAAELRAYRLYLEAEYQRLEELIKANENLGAFG